MTFYEFVVMYVALSVTWFFSLLIGRPGRYSNVRFPYLESKLNQVVSINIRKQEKM